MDAAPLAEMKLQRKSSRSTCLLGICRHGAEFKSICLVQTKTQSGWWWALGSSWLLQVQVAFCGKS